MGTPYGVLSGEWAEQYGGYRAVKPYDLPTQNTINN